MFPGDVDRYLDDHVRCCSSIVSDGDAVPFHNLVQGRKKCISLLHFSGSLFRAPGMNEKLCQYLLARYDTCLQTKCYAHAQHGGLH